MKEYRNVKKTKKIIRLTFIDMLNERRAFNKITVNELCERADIAKSTFYYHYTDIYAVAEEFENELISALSDTINGLRTDSEADFGYYFGQIMEFLKANEENYRKIICSDSTGPFIDKLKSIIAKKIFSQPINLPFSSQPGERLIQIRFFTNACVDTVADYFRGLIPCTLEEIGSVVIQSVKSLQKQNA